jgi:hypothetical protein
MSPSAQSLRDNRQGAYPRARWMIYGVCDRSMHTDVRYLGDIFHADHINLCVGLTDQFIGEILCVTHQQ